jgi:hypothetical protein
MYHQQFQYLGPLPPSSPSWMCEDYVLPFKICKRSWLFNWKHLNLMVPLIMLHTSNIFQKISRFMRPLCQANSYGINQYVYNYYVLLKSLMSFIFHSQTKIAEQVENHGAMFVPVISESDKTTVSVATGSQEYHPVYISPGNLTNIPQRLYGHSLMADVFLPIPKSLVRFVERKGMDER